MRLKITIKKAPLGCHQMVGKSFSCDDCGLTIGRADNNDLVLPDPENFVSSRHAVVNFSNGEFTIQDLSSNGLFLNQDDGRLGKGNFADLVDGVELRAGNYLLSVEVSDGESPASESEAGKTITQSAPDSENIFSGVSTDDIAEELAIRLGLNGMNETQLRAMPEEITTLIRRCVGSLMDVLSVRRTVKSELKMDYTVIQNNHAKKNNPLKVSANVDEALERMLANPSDAYMEPEQALIEAFADIGDHQVAIMAASLQVYQQVINRFEPEALENDLTEKGAASGRVFSKKIDWWEEYKRNYESIATRGTDNVREAFLRDFSNAYKEKLEALKKERNKKE